MPQQIRKEQVLTHTDPTHTRAPLRTQPVDFHIRLRILMLLTVRLTVYKLITLTQQALCKICTPLHLLVHFHRLALILLHKIIMILNTDVHKLDLFWTMFILAHQPVRILPHKIFTILHKPMPHVSMFSNHTPLKTYQARRRLRFPRPVLTILNIYIILLLNNKLILLRPALNTLSHPIRTFLRKVCTIHSTNLPEQVPFQSVLNIRPLQLT
jgi:hypothetical protein